MHDIEEDEIRVVGGGESHDDNKKVHWWIWCIAALIIICTIFWAVNLWPKTSPSIGGDDLQNAEDAHPSSIWINNLDDNLPSCTIVKDTVIDTLHLTIYTPFNAQPELSVGCIDTSDTDIILAAMAADLRRDNGKIVGAFVYAGEPLSWGLSKKGYCAIIDGMITIGMADNSPLFEQATEQGGYFFRQYPSVDKGVMIENNPENASFRRALCVLNGKICIVSCTDRVVMNDFSKSLVKLGVKEAILLIGGTADGWSRADDGHIVRFGIPHTKNKKYRNYIIFRKQ